MPATLVQRLQNLQQLNEATKRDGIALSKERENELETDIFNEFYATHPLGLKVANGEASFALI